MNFYASNAGTTEALMTGQYRHTREIYVFDSNATNTGHFTVTWITNSSILTDTDFYSKIPKETYIGGLWQYINLAIQNKINEIASQLPILNTSTMYDDDYMVIYPYLTTAGSNIKVLKITETELNQNSLSFSVGTLIKQKSFQYEYPWGVNGSDLASINYKLYTNGMFVRVDEHNVNNSYPQLVSYFFISNKDITNCCITACCNPNDYILI